MLTPIADSLNHTAGNSNLYPMCQEHDGLVWLQTKRSISPGEEMTTDFYETREDESAIDLINRYGIFEGGARERWSEADCKTIAASGIAKNKGSPLLRTAGHLA